MDKMKCIIANVRIQLVDTKRGKTNKKLSKLFIIISNNLYTK